MTQGGNLRQVWAHCLEGCCWWPAKKEFGFLYTNRQFCGKKYKAAKFMAEQAERKILLRSLTDSLGMYLPYFSSLLFWLYISTLQCRNTSSFNSKPSRMFQHLHLACSHYSGSAQLQVFDTVTHPIKSQDFCSSFSDFLLPFEMKKYQLCELVILEFTSQFASFNLNLHLSTENFRGDLSHTSFPHMQPAHGDERSTKLLFTDKFPIAYLL